jgi:hypothetical protein
VAPEPHSPTAKPIPLAGHGSWLYEALSGSPYVRFRLSARIVGPSLAERCRTPPAFGPVVVQIAKIVDIDQLQAAIVNHVELVVPVLR